MLILYCKLLSMFYPPSIKKALAEYISYSPSIKRELAVYISYSSSIKTTLAKCISYSPSIKRGLGGVLKLYYGWNIEENATHP